MVFIMEKGAVSRSFPRFAAAVSEQENLEFPAKLQFETAS
jgi:hypothetical protein